MRAPRPSKAGTGFTLWIDRQVTRRKLYHFVTDSSGAVVFNGRRVSDCLDHLDTIEVNEYLVALQHDPEPSRRFLCTMIERNH